MASRSHQRKMNTLRNNPNRWHTDLMGTILADPLYCCFAFWCGPCASYMLRKRALSNDMSSYECCAGYMPCSGRCGERRCPKFCLATEVFCCFGQSVACTRTKLQDEFNIRTTTCDECLMCFLSCLQYIECICSCGAKLLGCDDSCSILSCLASMVTYCTVSACMQTQHKIEMERVRAVPPVQLMSRIEGCPPPQTQS